MFFFQLENMMIDIKYRNYDETGLINTEINFIDFVKLFCNHKPVYGYSKKKIEKAFQTVILHSGGGFSSDISKDDFSSVLACKGTILVDTT